MSLFLNSIYWIREVLMKIDKARADENSDAASGGRKQLGHGTKLN